MDELLLGLLGWIFEIIVEAFFEVVLQLLADAAVRALSVLWNLTISRPLLAAITYFILGLLSGSLSTLVFPHPLVHPSRFHGISLLVSPVIAGLAMSSLGSLLRSRNTSATQIETFSYGFAFALGVALIRFFTLD